MALQAVRRARVANSKVTLAISSAIRALATRHRCQAVLTGNLASAIQVSQVPTEGLVKSVSLASTSQKRAGWHARCAALASTRMSQVFPSSLNAFLVQRIPIRNPEAPL